MRPRSELTHVTSSFLFICMRLLESRVPTSEPCQSSEGSSDRVNRSTLRQRLSEQSRKCECQSWQKNKTKTILHGADVKLLSCPTVQCISILTNNSAQRVSFARTCACQWILLHSSVITWYVFASSAAVTMATLFTVAPSNRSNTELQNKRRIPHPP